MKPWQDKDRLRELYVERGLSRREAAKELGCSGPTVVTWLRKHDLPVDKADRDKPPHYGEHSEGYPSWFHHDGEALRTVLVHRLLAVSEFGFDALYGNVVHHKNGCKLDNRAENIELLTRSEHIYEHQESLH